MATNKTREQVPETTAGIVAVRDGSGEVIGYEGKDGKPVPTFVGVMLDTIARQVDAESQDAALAIAESILTASTLEDVAGLAQETDSLTDLVGHVLTVREVKWQRGDYVEGLGVYAVVRAQDETSAVSRIITTGATNVVAFLFKCERSGWLPVSCQVRATKTAAGFDAYWLVPAPSAF